MILSIFFTSLGFTAVFSFLALRFFPKWGLMDRPERYGQLRAPIPYPAGVAVFLAFLANAFLFLPVFDGQRLLSSVLLGASILVLMSFWDDRRILSPYLRLGVQIGVALFLVWGGLGIHSITNPFGDPINLDSVNYAFEWGSVQFTITLFADLLTVLWVLTLVNAFNWIDGVPGMVNGSAAVGSFILLLLSMRPDFHYVDQSLAITLSSMVLGLSLGSLLFDFPPPKMLLGDTGSMLYGFLIAVIAMISGGKIATTILVLGLPFLDFIWTIGRRLLRGQSPFKGDLGHFHHRLLKAGFSPRQVILIFVASGVVLGGLSLLLHTEGKMAALLIFLSLMILFSLGLYRKK